MHSLFSVDKKKRWVVTPIRERVETTKAKREIVEHLKQHELSLVSVVRRNGHTDVAYSDVKGFDLAQTILNEHDYKDELYLELIGNDYLIIRIADSNIVEDRIISRADLIQSLRHRAQHKNDNQRYRIFHFNCESEIVESLEGLALIEEGKSWCIALHQSYLDSLDTGARYEFDELSYAQSRLYESKSSGGSGALKWVAGIAVAIFVSFQMVDTEEPKIVIKKVDDYKKYNQLLTSELPEVDSRLRQAFNLHVLLEKVPNWMLTKVNFHKDTKNPQFQMAKLSSAASLQGLTSFAKKYGLSVFTDKEGIWIQTFGANRAPFTKDTLYVDKLLNIYSNTKDNLGFISPHIDMQSLDHVIYDASQQQWDSKRVSLSFKSADKHDLLRIAAVFKGLPVTLEQASYTVDANKGLFQGNIILQIHGEVI